MKLIEVTYDKEGKTPIGDLTKFDPILAGEITTKKIYIKNVIAYPVDLHISIEGEDVDLEKNNNNRVSPGETKEVTLIFSPKLTKLQPVKADIKIHAVTLVE